MLFRGRRPLADHRRDLLQKLLRILQRRALFDALRQSIGLRVDGGLFLAGIGSLQAGFHGALLFGVEQVPGGGGFGEGLGRKPL